MMNTKPDPFNFDLIDACGYGYVRVWNERHYLLKLALIPVIIKFVAAIAVYALGYEENILRQGIILIPAILAQGWVLAQFLRTLLMEERWPQALPSTRDDTAIAKLILRARGIVSSTLVFVLIQLAMIVFIWAMLELNGAAEQAVVDQEVATDPSMLKALTIIPAVGFLLLVIWSFRLYFLYIPYAVLMPAREYLAKVSGFMTSVKMLGLFLVTMIPCTVTAELFSQFLMTILSGDAPEPTPIAQFAVALVRSVVDMITILIGTASLTYALRLVVPHHPDALKDVSGKTK